MKKLTWLADSRTNVMSFPPDVRDGIGYALYWAQLGEMSTTSNPLHGFGGGVMETVANASSTPRTAIELVRQRLKQLRVEVKSAETKKS